MPCCWRSLFLSLAFECCHLPLPLIGEEHHTPCYSRRVGMSATGLNVRRHITRVFSTSSAYLRFTVFVVSFRLFRFDCFAMCAVLVESVTSVFSCPFRRRFHACWRRQGAVSALFRFPRGIVDVFHLMSDLLMLSKRSTLDCPTGKDYATGRMPISIKPRRDYSVNASHSNSCSHAIDT